MSRFDWLSEYLARLEDEHVLIQSGSATALPPAHLLQLDHEDWGEAGRIAAESGYRLAGVWGDPQGDGFGVRACFEHAGDYLVLSTEVAQAQPIITSLAPYFPGADRLERHLHDMLGIVLRDHPDPRRWTRHQAWPDTDFPLRPDYPLEGRPPRRTPGDADYPFSGIQGPGVHEIPVGPVHAGIIEPGHFRFHAVGEDVLRLEARLGYAHKGIEKLAVGRDPSALARLAGRVSGDSTVAHAWAACQAMERATGCRLPERAIQLRALLCERERIANHLGDIGAICNDVGFAFAHMQCARLREGWLRRNLELFGHRLLMDQVIPGGVLCDLAAEGMAALQRDHAALRQAIEPIFDVIDDHPSLEDRLLGTGYLSGPDARALGCTGYVGKASGQGFDVRHHSPYPPYDGLTLEVPVQQEGDVAARVQIRMHEIGTSLGLSDRLIDGLSDGPLTAPLPEGADNAVGLGLIEGWRGEVLAFVRFGPAGRIARYFPRDPSWFTWPALERLIKGNIVPDFPVCNKSINGSYSGQDL